MNLRDALAALIHRWTEQADRANLNGQTRGAAHLYNSAEALELLLAQHTDGQPADVDDHGTAVHFPTHGLEHGLLWPDGRVVPTDARDMARWKSNPDVTHVIRRVTEWVAAPESVERAA
ncbi:hypothetical protein [Rhodococcoides fascians]|uniref:hypothetical protein n=1 Tax=Rhodococcoides fascians TaxID=1828 RepID=UPI00050CC0DC|nr:hypothetical protein [Rhodococcus fascians]